MTGWQSVGRFARTGAMARRDGRGYSAFDGVVTNRSSFQQRAACTPVKKCCAAFKKLMARE